MPKIKKCKKGNHTVLRWESYWTKTGIAWSGICSECGATVKSRDAPIEIERSIPRAGVLVK
jgi:hypothetical protein